MPVHEPKVEIEEVTARLTPADGVTTDDMLRDAGIEGATSIERLEDGSVLVTFYRRRA